MLRFPRLRGKLPEGLKGVFSLALESKMLQPYVAAIVRPCQCLALLVWRPTENFKLSFRGLPQPIRRCQSIALLVWRPTENFKLSFRVLAPMKLAREPGMTKPWWLRPFNAAGPEIVGRERNDKLAGGTLH